MQKVMIIGRVGRDPEARNSNNGNTIVSFSVACSEKRGGEEKTEWFRCKAFRQNADFVQRFITKGRLVYVEGKMETSKWQKDGQEHSLTELIVDRVEGLDRPADASQQAAPVRPQQHSRPSEMEELPW